MLTVRKLGASLLRHGGLRQLVERWGTMDATTDLARKRRALRDTLTTKLDALRSSREGSPPGFSRLSYENWLVAHIAKLDRLTQPRRKPH